MDADAWEVEASEARELKVLHRILRIHARKGRWCAGCSQTPYPCDERRKTLRAMDRLGHINLEVDGERVLKSGCSWDCYLSGV